MNMPLFFLVASIMCVFVMALPAVAAMSVLFSLLPKRPNLVLVLVYILGFLIPLAYVIVYFLG